MTPDLEKLDVSSAFANGGAKVVLDGIAQATEPGRPRWKSPAERALTVGELFERLPFSIASLNTATRGGLAAGKVVVVGGPPGGGKTSLVVQEALGWARAGVHVGILAADEDADGLLIRMGQQLGIDRGHLEQGMPAARAELAAAMRALPNLLLVDAEEEEQASLETVATELSLRRQPGQLAVLVLDSLQTIIPDANARYRDVRERVDAIVKLMKRLARRLKLIIVATSEISRGSYNTEDKSRRTSPLAAFKESGGIEYGVSLALVLTRFKEEGQQGVEAIVAKNRLGGHDDLPTIRLKMLASAASFEEVPSPTDEERERRDHEREEKMRQLIIEIIQKTPVQMTSANALLERMRGWRSKTKGLGANRLAWLNCIRDLGLEGQITGGRGRPYVVVIPQAAPEVVPNAI